jgi:hypothetical protein
MYLTKFKTCINEDCVTQEWGDIPSSISESLGDCTEAKTAQVMIILNLVFSILTILMFLAGEKAGLTAGSTYNTFLAFGTSLGSHH